MMHRIIEEISLFVEAVVNVLPLIRQRTKLAYEKRQVRNEHVWRTIAPYQSYEKAEIIPTDLYDVPDDILNQFLSVYFAKKLFKSMSCAATEFIRNKNVSSKIKE